MTMLRGALIEYGTGLIGPIPNVVIFQFNPESLSRALQIPPRPTGATQRETTQAGEKTFEKITFKAHFSAANMLDEDKVLARLFGIGPQLAALEKMVLPSSKIAGLIGAALDAIGGARSAAAPTPPAQPIPREKYPRILFIWGLTRVLPVTIDSMTIAEQEYDFLLNPVRAEVDITLSRDRRRPVLRRRARQGRARVLDDRQGGAGDRQPRQHGRADRRSDPV